MKKNQKNKTKPYKVLSLILFVVYIIALFYFLFFSEGFGRTITDRGYSYNLTPFKEIRRYIVYREKLGTFAVVANLAGNIIGFMPFGFMMPVISVRRRNIFTMAFLSFLLSLIIESIQLVLRVGSFDVDDMILNTIGGILGYVLFIAGSKYRRKNNGKKKKC
ncbi:VanZ family protein [Anaerobium acetethylicum]|uniref:Glycopeptide antibiotics resistance protein n=1 Tax=Anaerobium acetethylicum TaxID=1619234 RepID=A0A1D3TQW7_9FIRM|nr:VanZ family protein [Anaerobium acetethylicum]SCP96025.1 Glycopeptide antibiotics resistance protein [Anaerobium acetethylicum]